MSCMKYAASEAHICRICVYVYTLMSMIMHLQISCHFAVVIVIWNVALCFEVYECQYDCLHATLVTASSILSQTKYVPNYMHTTNQNVRVSECLNACVLCTKCA
jgi:hypothetical protein